MRLPRERFDYSRHRRPPTVEAAQAGPASRCGPSSTSRSGTSRRPMARQYLTAPQGVATVPDVPNWAWHDYGMRVGFWRLCEALAKRKIRATTAINAHVVPVLRAGGAAPCWTRAGSSWATGSIQGAMHLLPDQRAAIRQADRASCRSSPARSPRAGSGRASPRRGRRSTMLAEEGIEYVSDWVNDDQPYEIRTQSGPLVSVPYTLELNDIPMMVIQHHESRRVAAALQGPVRPALRRGRQEPAGDGDRRAPLHLRRAAPDQVLRGGVRLHAQARRACGSPPARRSTSGGRPASAENVARRRESGAPCLDFAFSRMGPCPAIRDRCRTGRVSGPLVHPSLAVTDMRRRAPMAARVTPT